MVLHILNVELCYTRTKQQWDYVTVSFQQDSAPWLYVNSSIYHQGKTKEKTVPHLTNINENNCYKNVQTIQLLVIKYESNTHKISQIKSTQNTMCNAEECHTVNYMVFWTNQLWIIKVILYTRTVTLRIHFLPYIQ